MAHIRDSGEQKYDQTSYVASRAFLELDWYVVDPQLQLLLLLGQLLQGY
jgi:hypothetical protein